jgi:signal transduction histidine kinase/ActR/RegA family two-component response regulator
MALGTGTALAVAGIALFFAERYFTTARTLALVSLVLGLASLFYGLFRQDLPLNAAAWNCLFASTDGTRVAPLISTAIIVLALTILALTVRSPRVPLLALLGGGLLFLALLPVVNCLIARSPAHFWSSYQSVGFASTATLLLTAILLLSWIARRYAETGLSTALLFSALALLFAVGATTRQSLSQFRASAAWIADMHATALRLERIVGRLARAESSARSYMLTGEEAFSRRFDEEKQAVKLELDTLGASVRNGDLPESRRTEFQAIVENILWQNETLVHTRHGGTSVETPHVIDAVESVALRDLQAIEKALHAEQEARLALAFVENRQTEANTRTLQLLGGTAAALLVGLAYWITWRALHAQRAAKVAMTEARDQAMDHSRLKSEFLANMSHEVRTPMNGVIGMTNLLAETKLNPEQREYVDTIRVSGETLLVLINDILDFSKIEAGKIELEEKEFDLVSCIEATLLFFKSQAQSKGLQLRCVVDPSIHRTVVGDATRVRQIVANLVNNALKFTPSGHVEVAVRALETAASDSMQVVSISVTDTGIGIPEDKRHRLFQPFTQVDASTNRRFGGTGLGLSISRHLTELMGGKIEVESVEGEGSTFSFTLRLKKVSRRPSPSAPVQEIVEGTVIADPGRPTAPADSAVSAETSDSAAGDELKILLVEDNAVNQVVAQRILTKIGYRATTVGNGQEALDVLERHTYDIVLMDLQMPGIDGLTATELLRKRSASKQPWVIAITANAMRGDRERCLAAGMDDYISKPVKPDQLRAALERAKTKIAAQALCT